MRAFSDLLILFFFAVGSLVLFGGVVRLSLWLLEAFGL